MSTGATAPKAATGRQGERARTKFLEMSINYLRAGTANQRIRYEAECRRLAVGLSPTEVTALTEAASKAVARDR